MLGKRVPRLTSITLVTIVRTTGRLLLPSRLPVRAGNLVRILAGAALVLFVFGTLFAQDAADSTVVNPRYERNVKGVFLYSFGRYFSWPDHAFEQTGGNFVIGVLGESKLVAVLDKIAAAKKVHGRTIVVRQFAAPADYEPCQVLFVSQSVTPKEMHDVAARTHSEPVLIVGETPGFAQQFGAVNFYLMNNGVHFEMNVNSIRAHGLAANPKVLALARLVEATDP